MLSILATAGLSLLLYLTGVFIFLTPFPILLHCVRRGASSAATSLLLGLVLLAFLYRLPSSWSVFLPFFSLSDRLGIFASTFLGLLYFFSYGWIGLTVATAARRSLSVEKGIMILVAVTVGVPLAIFFLAAHFYGFEIVSEIRTFISDTLQKMVLLQEQSGLGEEELLTLKGFAATAVDHILVLLPAIVINFTLVTLSLNILFLRRWIRTERLFPSWADLSLWQFQERWIWLPIGVGLGYFINLYLLQNPVLAAIFLNVLIVLAAVYLYQGLAVVLFFLQKRLSPWSRIFAYFAILLFIQLMAVVIIALGLFDFWFDFRKLKKVVSPAG